MVSLSSLVQNYSQVQVWTASTHPLYAFVSFSKLEEDALYMAYADIMAKVYVFCSFYNMQIHCIASDTKMQCKCKMLV